MLRVNTLSPSCTIKSELFRPISFIYAPAAKPSVHAIDPGSSTLVSIVGVVGRKMGLR